jgi:hypothetical protein
MAPEHSVLADFDRLEDDTGRLARPFSDPGRRDRKALPARDAEEAAQPVPPRRATAAGWTRQLGALRNRLPGWRGLAWFWAAVLTVTAVSAALLQMLGPPGSDAAREPPATAPVQARLPATAEPPRAPQPTVPATSPGPRRLPSDRVSALLSKAETQIAQGRLHVPPGDNAAESLAEVYSLIPAGSAADLKRADAMMARLDQRVRAATRTGDLEEAQRAPSKAGLDQTARVIPRGAAESPGTPAAPDPGPGAAASAPTSGPLRPFGVGLSIHYSAGSASSGDEAKQVATRLGSRFDRADLQGEAEVPQKAIVRFFSPDDHATARTVGKMLAEMGYTWRIDNLSRQASPSSPRTIEVWLPAR